MGGIDEPSGRNLPRAVLELRVYDSQSGRDTPVVDSENTAAIAQLRAWSEAEATDDPAAVRQAEVELNELLQNLNANRVASGERPLLP